MRVRNRGRQEGKQDTDSMEEEGHHNPKRREADCCRSNSPPKSNKCTPSTCQSARSAPKSGRNSSAIDTCRSSRRRMCCCSTVIRNFRYDIQRQKRESWDKRKGTDFVGTAGDVEFLETAHACAEVFPRRGGSEGEVTEEFHTGFY